MITEHFFAGLENTKDGKERGRIYLGHKHFANFYTAGDGFTKEHEGKIIFNRDSYAFDLNHPSYQKPFNNILEMLCALEEWFETEKIVIKLLEET